MTLKCHAKSEENLTCGLENNTKNLSNLHRNTWKHMLGSVKIGTLMRSFCPN